MFRILFRLGFFAWRRRRLGFLFFGSGIKDIIVKFSRRFSQEIYFRITSFISFFQALLERVFLSSSWLIIIAFITITNIPPYMAKGWFSFITRFSIFTECFNYKTFFSNIWGCNIAIWIGKTVISFFYGGAFRNLVSTSPFSFMIKKGLLDWINWTTWWSDSYFVIHDSRKREVIWSLVSCLGINVHIEVNPRSTWISNASSVWAISGTTTSKAWFWSL